jgi:ATP-binding cassette subfamily B protein
MTPSTLNATMRGRPRVRLSRGPAGCRTQRSRCVPVDPAISSSLDAHAEHALFERYAATARRTAARTGAITIIVSHGFSTVRMADLILVMDHRRLIEHGDHASLMTSRGTYAGLFNLKARAYR